MRRILGPATAACLALSGCTTEQVLTPGPVAAISAPADVDVLIVKYAKSYDVPADLVRSVVRRESNFNPKLAHRGNYGLMQIKPATARTMGYEGSAAGLLDADTNLRYGVKYLRGAYVVAGRNSRRAESYYRSGYYYRAKRMGLLEEAGLK